MVSRWDELDSQRKCYCFILFKVLLFPYKFNQWSIRITTQSINVNSEIQSWIFLSVKVLFSFWVIHLPSAKTVTSGSCGVQHLLTFPGCQSGGWFLAGLQCAESAIGEHTALFSEPLFFNIALPTLPSFLSLHAILFWPLTRYPACSHIMLIPGMLYSQTLGVIFLFIL